MTGSIREFSGNGTEFTIAQACLSQAFRHFDCTRYFLCRALGALSLGNLEEDYRTPIFDALGEARKAMRNLVDAAIVDLD